MSVVVYVACFLKRSMVLTFVFIHREEDFNIRLEDHLEKARLKCKAELRDRETKINAKEIEVYNIHIVR